MCFFLSSTTSLWASCFQATPFVAFSAPISAATAIIQITELDSQKMAPNTETHEQGHRSNVAWGAQKDIFRMFGLLSHVCATAASWWSRLLDRNQPFQIGVHPRHTLSPARMSQCSVIMGDHSVTINPSLQGSNGWFLETDPRGPATHCHQGILMLPRDFELHIQVALFIQAKRINTTMCIPIPNSYRHEAEQHTSWIRAWWRSHDFHWINPTCRYRRCRPWTLRINDNWKTDNWARLSPEVHVHFATKSLIWTSEPMNGAHTYSVSLC